MGFTDRIELDIDTPANLPNIGIYKLGLHVIQILFAFLTFCIILPVISIEGHYSGSSRPAPNYTLVVTLVSMFVSVALAIFPWSKYRNHLIPIRNFFIRPRTTFILTGFLTLAWFIAMVSMTAHSNNDENCTLNQKLMKDDTDYPGAWIKQCNSAKAAAAFCWLSFFVWLPSAVCSFILLWHETKVRHAEADAAAAKVRSQEALNSDEDAQTIVDMDYPDKESKDYRYDTASSTHSEDEPRPTETHPFPMAPTETPREMPAFISPPSNLVSPYHPHTNNITSVGSPYSIPASVASPYPPSSTFTHNSYQPYQTSTASYSNIPLEQNYTGSHQYTQQNYPPTTSYSHYDYPAYGA